MVMMMMMGQQGEPRGNKSKGSCQPHIESGLLLKADKCNVGFFPLFSIERGDKSTPRALWK